MEYETVIGLEVHLQLSTASKIFCGASAEYGAEPNEYVDPYTLGLPGVLPVLNRRVVNFALMLGIAMNCEVRRINRFARKHYFYPDLPKGYQVSQFEEPICERGHIDIHHGDAVRTIGIKRIHMEEDAGKNIHDSRTQTSLVDLNRAGVPLLEIVSEPDIRSSDEAGAYLRTLRQIARFLEISDGNMEEGSLRCDANVSLRPVGEMKFGTRTEIKNINSFKFVEQALEYEVARQLSILKSGKEIVLETRLFDSESGTTRSMRSKEESAEYRYFPDPDLPPLVIEDSWIEILRATMPKLPEEHRKSLVESYGLSAYDADILIAERLIVEYFEKVFQVCSNAKAACSWVTSELFGVLKKEGLDITKSPVSAASLGELIKLIDSEIVSGKMAKLVFEEMFASGKPPQQIIEERGMKQITDEGQICRIVLGTFDKNPGQLKEFVGGNDRLHAYFVGQVMKETKGNASPKLVNEIITRECRKLREKGRG